MKVIDFIAEGGFGRVEKVKLSNGELVARKTFKVRADIATLYDIGKLRKRFQREVRIQSGLPTDKFIPVIAHGLDDDPPWFLMPLADRNFETEIAIARKAQTSPKEALAQILESLEQLQSLQMTHRDLKPSNVLFHKGRWKLCDFGFAAVPPGDTTKLTTTLTPFGTALYCAPEQLLGFGNVTPAADIYSFGCVLHDIFDGGPRLPFHRHTCAGALGGVVERCTDPDPKKRFKTITGLRSALFGVLSAPPKAILNPEIQSIVKNLANVSQLATGELEEIKQFIRHPQDFSEKWFFYRAIDEDVLIALHELDSDLWTDMVAGYLEWAKGIFDFTYCDVIIGRLEKIFELGSVSEKAGAALAAASLGASHNRWFVMRRLQEMCNAGLDPVVAQRIAIEIRAEEAEREFLKCANALGDNAATVYHPAIVGALDIDD